LKAAIRKVLQGSGWQLCRVHAMRNLLAVARTQLRSVISALIRTIFAQPDVGEVGQPSSQDLLGPVLREAFVRAEVVRLDQFAGRQRVPVLPQQMLVEVTWSMA